MSTPLLDFAFPRKASTGYDAELDSVRLTGLQAAVFELMKDGVWRTHSEMKTLLQRGSENGIAAVLRDLRHHRKGAHVVEKRRRGNGESGLWEYKLLVNTGG